MIFDKNDWRKWKDAFEAELDSLVKWKVFRTPKGAKPIRYKWIFVQKQNENGKIIRLKVWLVAQEFSQRPNIDFKETFTYGRWKYFFDI